MTGTEPINCQTLSGAGAYDLWYMGLVHRTLEGCYPEQLPELVSPGWDEYSPLFQKALEEFRFAQARGLVLGGLAWASYNCASQDPHCIGCPRGRIDDDTQELKAEGLARGLSNQDIETITHQAARALIEV